MVPAVFFSSSFADPWIQTFGMIKNVQENNSLIQRERMTVPANSTTRFYSQGGSIQMVFRPPCCSDSITAAVCKKLQLADNQHFALRCLSDADFSLVQCCSTCGMAQADERYKHFFALGTDSPHCFDRHSTDFCDRLREGTGFWQNTRWTCSGDSTPLAFRVCRKTCGYCNGSIYETSTGRFTPKSCGRKAEFLPARRY
ncbi:hypothetical protein PMAYCL1PPCAC_02671 [Pristionchus mayeri]|uniref:Uncharacterized protein n=1 Tax=Pristionchus mayeri TaxID=1317129 RepID=A0AAN4Z268_9BILA|nr:hypothetical protein PMAYCL1PPCAC_02671 [Pristionchus mayeri]